MTPMQQATETTNRRPFHRSPTVGIHFIPLSLDFLLCPIVGTDIVPNLLLLTFICAGELLITTFESSVSAKGNDLCLPTVAFMV